MATVAPRRRRPSSGSRLGYLVSVAVNAALLMAVNVWPGWRSVPFLTYDTREVLGVLNAALLVGMLVNLVYVAWDQRWLKAICDLVLGAFALAVLARIWQVFPFTVESEVALAVRVVIGVVALGVAIGMLVSLAVLARAGR
jgi:hypothetical protein